MELPVTEDMLERFYNGELVQDVFPHMTEDQREFLLTGAVPGEFEAAFPEQEHSEEEGDT